MRWHILIASVEPRTETLCELLDILSPQLVPGEVEVLCYRDGFQQTVGLKKDFLVQTSTAEYTSFLDDDDLVVPDFVETLLPLLDGTDYVSFNLEAHGCEYNHFLVRQSLYHLPHSPHHTDHRCLNIGHLCPIRREIVAQGHFGQGYNEDSEWAEEIYRRWLIRTEHHVERVLYYYRVSDSTLWTGERHEVPVSPHPAYPCVSYLEEPHEPSQG